MSETLLPLTAGQAGMWLAHQVDSSNPMYSIAECVQIHGPIAPALFDEAIELLVAETDALRVRFVPGEETPRQIVGAGLRHPVRHVDFGTNPDPAGAAERWMTAAASEPVDVLAGPLWTFALLRLGEDRFTWFIKVHHTIVDGYSSALFTARVAEIYSALVAGQPCPPSPFGSLADLVAVDAAYRSSADFTRDQAYWLQRCSGQTEPARLAGRPARIPTGHIRDTATLSARDADGLRQAGREIGVAWPIVTIAGIAAYLHRMTGREDIVLGFAVTGRTGRSSRTTPGMVSNAVPLVLTVRPDMPVAELFEQVSAEVRSATRHQRYRAEDLHRDLRLVGDRKRLWGPEVNLLLYGEDPSFAGAPGTVRGFSVGPEEDMTLVVDGRSGTGLRLDLHANDDLYTEETVSGHRDRLTDLLRDIATGDPYRPVALLDVVSPTEREKLDLTATCTPSRTLCDLIGSGPVVHRGVTFTGVDLDADANRLARYLIADGAGPGDVVAIIGTPSIDQVRAILAVLRAGAAYILADETVPVGVEPSLTIQAAQLPDAARYEANEVTDADRRIPLTPAHPAYLRSDLAVISHATAAASLQRMGERHQLSSEDRVLYRAAADAPLLALTCGATTVIAEPDLRDDPSYLADLIADDKITVEHVDDDPMAGVRVLDDAMRPVPPSVPGAVYLPIGPDWFLGDPGRTASTMVANPAGPPGSRMYVTGLVASDGQIAVVDELPDTVRQTRRAPLNAREETLCRLVADVLGVPQTGPTDDFFELGGQSLTAIRLAGRIKTEFGVEISLRTIFERRTVAALAELVTGSTAARPPLRPIQRPDRIPLSLLQGGLWFINRTDGASGMYNTGIALRLRGVLDRPAVAEALTDVVRRHESLRTVFPEDGGIAYQLIRPSGGVVVNVSSVDVDEAGLDQAVTAAASIGFDLGDDLPIRGHLLRVSPVDHVLVLILHHIVSDGWSLAPLARDFAAAYTARTAGRAPQFPPLELQYADYTLWQREVLGDEENPDSPLARQLAYWQGALAGLPDETPLPMDFPRPATRDYSGGTVQFEIDPSTHRALADLALEHRASTVMVLRGVVATVLTRLGAGTDIPLGMAVTGRTEDALQDVIGCLINTLVFRTDTAGSPGFGELLDRIRESDLGAYGNRDVPFARLVEALNPERSLSRNPLFQVMLDVQAAPTDTVSLPGLTVAPHQIDPGSTKVDLRFCFEEHPETGIRGRLEYSLDLFEPSTAEAIVRRLLRVLDSVLADPWLPIDQIDVLDSAERAWLLHDYNDTARPAPVSVLESIEAQVRSTPDRPALRADGVEINYAELNERVNRLAHLLMAEGVGPERLVALALPRSADLVIAMLAVLKAGGGYLPVDPEDPSERVTYVLTDADPVLVLTNKSFVDVVATSKPTLLLEQLDGLAAQPSHNPVRIRDGAQTAYVIYTSGSTGRPKGVVVEHRAFAQYMDYAKANYSSLGGNALLHSPVSFDMAVTTLYGPLMSGGCVVVADLDEPGPEPHFSKITPSHLPLLTAGQGAVSPSRELVIGGEQLVGETLSEWRELHPDVAVINEYGPTETTVGCSAHRLEPGQQAPSAVPMGRPTWNSQMYLLDNALRLVPAGVVGEVYVGGAQLARGYLGRPGLTASRFVADPFGAPGSRLYRTGDLARWNNAGGMEFLSRVDEQVKLRGFRIELGEIESVLSGAPGVASAAVVVREDQPGLRRLVGYVVPAQQDLTEVQDWVAARLPDYMLPSVIVGLADLPLSPSGKLDRDALPRPEPTARPSVQPGTEGPEEKVLRELFADLLGVTDVGLSDSFFELGGDSIISIQLVARARQAGLELKPKEVFQYKTVARLAQLAASRLVQDKAPAKPADVGTGQVRPTPIMRWWRDLGGPLDGIHQAALVEVPEGIRLPELTGAVRAVLDRHDALRMRVGEPFELTIPPAGQTQEQDQIRRVDLTELDELARDEAITEHADDARRRLSASDGVMVHFVWFDEGPGHASRLLIMAHHLVIDGVSWRILLPDMRAAAEAIAAGRKPELSPVGTSVRRWAELLADAAESSRAELPFWLDTLRDGDTTLTARQLDPVRDVAATARSHTRVLPVSVTGPLLTVVPSVFHAGVNDILLTALAVAVGKPELVVDLEGHGREDLADDVDLSRTVGWFTTMYPVRLAPGPVDLSEFLAGGPAVGKALREVKEQLRAVPRNGIGFGLLRYLGRPTELSTKAVPSILVNYLGRIGSSAPWDPLADTPPLGAPTHPQTPMSHALELDVIVRDGADGPQLFATWTWPQALMSEETVQQLAEVWCQALQGAVRHAENPDAGGYTPSDLPLVSLSQEDIESLEAEWRTLQ